MVNAEPTLKFNILQSYPFGYTDQNSQTVGTYWEYVRALDDRVSYQIDQQVVPKARVVEYLKRGWIDASILFKSKNLDPYVEYVAKVRDIPILLVTAKGIQVEKYEDLYRLKKIGIFKSGSINARFDEDDRIKKESLYNYPQMVEVLMAGRVEAIIGNGIVLQALLGKRCQVDQVNISPLVLGEREQWLVFSKTSKNIEQVRQTREAINGLATEGVLNQIFDRHLNVSASQCRNQGKES